jgi:hypothetical protein
LKTKYFQRRLAMGKMQEKMSESAKRKRNERTIQKEIRRDQRILAEEVETRRINRLILLLLLLMLLIGSYACYLNGTGTFLVLALLTFALTLAGYICGRKKLKYSALFTYLGIFSSLILWTYSFLSQFTVSH